MKSTRKFISWLLVMAMLITCVPVISFAETQENAVNASKYIINDNFSQNNINGWTVYDTSKMSAFDVVDSDDETNYAMQITTSQAPVASGESDNIYVYKEMPNGGIPYTENADIIIETRVKIVSGNSGLIRLKFDLDGTNDGINANTQTFFQIKKNELNWRIASSWGATSTTLDEDITGQWVDAKVRIKGTTKSADYAITVGDTTYAAEGPANVFKNEMGDALTNLAFRTFGSDSVQVDYIRVYKEYNASVSVSSIMTPDGSVGVTLDADEAPLNLADYVTLKDSTGTVDEYAELTQIANTVAVKTSKTVSDGEIFTVVVNKAGLEDLGYIFDDETTEFTVTASKYYMNDNFGPDDINGWSANGSKMTATAIADPDDSSNYVMHIKNTQVAVNTGESDNINVLKALSGDGISYTENSDVIIETKFKLANDNARMFLKFDLDGTNDILTGNLNTFFVAKPDELNWRIKKSTWGDTGVAPVEETLAGQWLTAKVRIKGTSKTADYEIKTEENTYSATNIDAKVFNNVVNGKSEMGEALTNLAFKTWGNDEVYVDYIKVYKEYKLSFSVPEIISSSGEISITADSEKIPSNLADYFALKDGTGAVDENAEIVQDGNVVTIKTSKDVANGETFTVVVDNLALKELGYIIEDDTDEYTVTASKYIINDDFGSDDLNGWTVNGAKMSASAVADGDNNYAMQITNTQSPVASGESDNLYVYKEMPGNGITYTEDSDIIIETRVKVVSGNSGLIRLKFDLDGTNDGINSNTQTFFQVKKNELNWRIASSWGATSTTLPADITGQWVDAKVRIKGTTKSADYAITVGDTTYTAVGPANVFKNEMGDALTNLAFRTFGSDSVAVDYIRVYRAYSASVSVPSTMTLDGSFDVTFDSQTVPSNLASYFTLKDSTGAVDENAEMTLSDNVLTVKASKEKIADGEEYTFVIDKAGLEGAGYFLTGDVTEYTVTASKYIINDDFGSDDLNGWKVNGAKMSASAVADGDNNYAMQITNTQSPVASGESDNLYVYKEMPGNGITYTEDSDIIIETRVKVVSGNSGRIQMRFDLDGTNYQINSNKNVFFQVTSTKLNWRIASSWGSTDTTLPENIMNQWVDAKVRIKGTSKSADYAITVGDTTYTAEGPANVFSTEMGDALTNLAFSTFGSDAVAVDYIRVYRAYGASVSVPENMYLDGSFAVTFDSQAVPSNLASYFTLKDSTGAVDENAEMTLSDNVLTIKASKGKIADGEEYTLVIDKAGLEGAGYFLTGDVTEYTVTASKYIINDDFGSEDLNGWKVNGVKMSASAVADGDNNYAMQITNTQAPVASGESDNLYVYKEMPGNGITYTEDSDIIIETRVKVVSGNSGLIRLKFDLDGTNDGINSNTQTFFQVKKNELNWRIASSWGATSTTLPADITGQWVTAKVRIKGTSKSADYEITVGDTTYTAVGPANVFKNEMGDALTNLAFRTFGSDSVAVDYIRVYQAKTLSLDFDGEKIDENGAMYIWTTEGMLDAVKENTALYDSTGATQIDADVSVDTELGAVKIVPASNLECGTYKVKVNADASALSEYVLNQTEFVVTVYDNSVSYAEDFEDSNNWALRLFDMTDEQTDATISTETENGNSFLRLSAKKHPKYSTISTPGVTMADSTGTNGFIFDSDGYTVFETKMRSNGTNLIKYFKVNTTNEDWYNHGYNLKAMFAMDLGDGSDISHGLRRFDGSGAIQGRPTMLNHYNAGQWYLLRTIYDNANRTVSFYVFDETGNLVGSEINTLSLKEPYSMNSITDGDENSSNNPAYWNNFKDINATDREQLRFIDELSVSIRGEINLAAAETVDIDDVKLYNTTDISSLVGDVIEIKLMKNGTQEVTDGLIEQGVSYTPVAKSTTMSGIDVNYTFIAALYENGQLKMLKSANNDEPMEAIVVPNTEAEYKIKLFLWKADTMIPLCEAVEYEELENSFLQLYVDPVSGSNAASGFSKSEPVKTVEEAQNRLTQVINEGTVSKGVEIILREGNYEFSTPVVIDSTNTFEKPVVYRAYTNEKVNLIGGKSHSLADSVKVTDEEVLARLSDQSVRERIYSIDLSDFDIPAPSLPGAYEAQLKKWFVKYGVNYPYETTTCEVFFGTDCMTNARYPNDGYITDAYKYYGGAIPAHWEDGKIGTSDYVAEANRNINDGFRLKYTLDRIDAWKNAEDALLFGYFGADWATQTVPLKNIDAENNVIESAHPSYIKIPDGRIPRFYVYNLIEELDTEGEYYIDRSTKTLYFYRSDEMTDDKNLFISLYNNPVIKMQNANNVTIKDIAVTATRNVGIDASYCNNTIIDNCEVSNTAGKAIWFNQSTNTVVENCDIHDVNGGIHMNGGDIATLTQSNNVVKNNKITNFSRIDKVYTYAISLYGVGNKATHNDISGSEHAALNFVGCFNEVSYNKIHDVLKETADAGAIYVGRSWSNRDNVIKNNYFYDIPAPIDESYPNAAVYFDDHYSSCTTLGNVFANINGIGVKAYGGRELKINNNLFINCPTSASIMCSYPYDKFFNENNEDYELADAAFDLKYPSVFYTHEKTLSTIPYTSEIWVKEFPEFCEMAQTNQSYFRRHLKNEFTNNVEINSDIYIQAEAQSYMDLTKNDAYKATESDFVDFNSGNYNLTTNALETIKNTFKTFVNIDFSSIGIQ